MDLARSARRAERLNGRSAMHRRWVLGAACAAITFAAAHLGGTPFAQAQSPDPAANYPNQTVKLVVPFAPGGSTDALARLVGQMLGEKLGQRFVIENVGGAGGTVGAAQV